MHRDKINMVSYFTYSVKNLVLKIQILRIRDKRALLSPFTRKSQSSLQDLQL